MATAKTAPGIRKKGVAVKFTRKNGVVVKGKTSSAVLDQVNGDWINVKDDGGVSYKVRPSQLTAI